MALETVSLARVTVTLTACIPARLRIIRVVIAPGFHLFPFRTEKLSPVAPMVLQCNAGE